MADITIRLTWDQVERMFVERGDPHLLEYVQQRRANYERELLDRLDQEMGLD